MRHLRVGVVLILMGSVWGLAAQTDAPVPQVGATLAPAADGNGADRATPQWYLRGPVTVHLHATDAAGITAIHYSLDDGATTLTAPITPGATVEARFPVSQQGITQIRYWATGGGGRRSVGPALELRGRGGATALMLATPVAAGATAIRVSNTTLLKPGEELMLGNGMQSEAITIASIAAEPPGGPAASAGPGRGHRSGVRAFYRPALPPANVTLAQPLHHDHIAGDGLYQPYDVVAVAIDSEPPVATWPDVTDDKIPQSGTLEPKETDPRRRSASDTGHGSGGAAIFTMEMDGRHVFPKVQDMNRLTVGKHTQMVELHDVAGNARRYTLTFEVTTSFDDLNQVLTEYVTRAWKTTLDRDALAGATGVQLTQPLGFRAGETLLIGSPSSRERVTITSVASPPPQNGPDVTFAPALKEIHSEGEPASNPRPLISEAGAAKLRALLKQAQSASTAGNASAAVGALDQFKTAVPTVTEGASERAALTSAADALIAQVQGHPAAIAGLGVTSAPGTPVIRVYLQPTPPAHHAGAAYKVLVNGHVVAGNYRHESIVDVEAMVQKLGAAHGFDVDVWDPPTSAGPGRLPPAGVSLPASPFRDLKTLEQYKTIIFDSSVGRDPTGTLDPDEFANFQAYIRHGGGFIAIHGGDDAYQNVPWYTHLDGAGFTMHGSNAGGIMPDCGACDEVELYNFDPSNPATKAFPEHLIVHEELYNTNPNPVALDEVHPLVEEDESALINQLNVPNPGPLLNSDQHGMAWCHDVGGTVSYTILLGHTWQFMLEPWYQQMVLGAIQATAHQVPANCSTFAQAEALLKTSSAAGDTTLGQALAEAKADYNGGRYQQALTPLATVVSRSAASPALAPLHQEAVELNDWMKELSQRPPITWGSALMSN